jgi:proline dehydrogenase
MIGLARSERLKRFMQAQRGMSALARRYVGGSNPASAIATARGLSSQGIGSSFFYLGEYVTTEALVAENVAAQTEVIQLLGDTDLDVNVSIDPTQVGGTLNWALCASHIARLATSVEAIAADRPGAHCIMLDMEDFAVNARTIELHDHLADGDLPVALTLQAYLRKTYTDMERQVTRGSRIRLVKGAFAAGRDLAYSTSSEIKESYRQLIDLMLSAGSRGSGFYPIFATHDEQLHAYAVTRARAQGWAQGTYEFEMLYGARPDVARRLADAGERIRLYLPFGTDWWPYAVRRIGENPANALLLAKAMLGNNQ